MTTRTALLFLAALAAACSTDEQPTAITPQAALGVTAQRFITTCVRIEPQSGGSPRARPTWVS